MYDLKKNFFNRIYNTNSVEESLIPNEDIRLEFKKYDWQFINEFANIYNKDSNAVCICRFPKIYIESVEEFWKNWNQFKKIRVFI